MDDSLNTCPQCGRDLAYSARSCTCGWNAKQKITRSSASITGDPMYAALRDASVRRAQDAAEQWMSETGLARGPGQTVVEHLRVLAGYRGRIRATPRPDSRYWAVKIMERHAAGENVDLYAVDLARKEKA